MNPGRGNPATSHASGTTDMTIPDRDTIRADRTEVADTPSCRGRERPCRRGTR